MKYPSCPEIIATVEVIDSKGDDFVMGDKIAGVSVAQSKSHRDGIVTIDVRGLDGLLNKKTDNLTLRLPLPELMAALQSATLNADRDVD